MFKGVNVCVYVGEGLRRSFATPDPFVLTNKICLNQPVPIRSLKLGNAEVFKYLRYMGDWCSSHAASHV